MNGIINEIGNLASFIGSLTVVGSALLWIYNKWIMKPLEKRRKKEADERQGKMIALITQKNEPLNRAIKELNTLLTESQLDRKKLNEIVSNHTKNINGHEVRLDDHNTRIVVLETKVKEV